MHHAIRKACMKSARDSEETDRKKDGYVIQSLRKETTELKMLEMES